MEVIIWNEVTPSLKWAFEAVDRLFRVLSNNDRPFGCKMGIVSGDFRQTLPVVRNENRVKIVENCIKSSYWCHGFTFMSLIVENLRTWNNDEKFKQCLLQIGEGIFTNKFETDNEVIDIPKELLSKNDIHNYENILKSYKNVSDVSYHNKVILAQKNVDVLDMNVSKCRFCRKRWEWKFERAFANWIFKFTNVERTSASQNFVESGCYCHPSEKYQSWWRAL